MMRIPVALLAQAIPRATIHGRSGLVITGLATDSREAKPGDLFACIPGTQVDGHSFIPALVKQGVRCFLVERMPQNKRWADCTFMQVPKVTRALGKLAHAFYNDPTLSLTLVGVTGTNGKTTTTYLIRSILEQGSPAPVGMIGTIQHAIGNALRPAHNTTPMAWELQRLFYEMHEAKCRAAVMEVSSHALSQDRVEGCEFDIAVFTNLTPEHLDYHRTMAEYSRAKQALFHRLTAPGFTKESKVAVINGDDPYGREMVRAAKGARILSFGLKPGQMIRAEAIRLDAQGSEFTLKTPDGNKRIRLALPGSFNIYNALAAAGVGLGLGLSLDKIRQGLQAVQGVPGRMQNVTGSYPFRVVVDFAHKPDALEKVLETTREYTQGRLIVLFGCGGNRDILKRSRMGAIAHRLADVVVITTDNPRQEEPQTIIRAITAGFEKEAQQRLKISPVLMFTEVDRKRAIERALAEAQPGDVVLLAGKGHETYQILKDQAIPFNDYAIAQHTLQKLMRRKKWKG